LAKAAAPVKRIETWQFASRIAKVSKASKL
jgi:hypothetical protein